ncbi:helix-turn-helix transcriptional regulator [Amycolatopsis sp. WGS_07]|uniref:helix-turn-helix transcriptional regulator n=1 Tax=Amycolatopsis sp. WGS_07 TaxID=3076764 RepID=UPI003872DCFC
MDAPFGRALRHHREQRNLTQKELAVKAGLSECTIRRWETGRHRNPQIMSVQRAADALDLKKGERERLLAAAMSEPSGGED